MATVNGTTITLNEILTITAKVSATCGSTSTLTVMLDQVTLTSVPLRVGPLTATISATSGTTLGSLICNVANVLDSNGSLRSLVQKLNKVLAAL